MLLAIWLVSSIMFLWLMFILTTYVIDDAENWNDLSSPRKVWVGLFLIIDVFMNYTACTVLFWEFADWESKTLTARLKHIIHSGFYAETEWRFKGAVFMCRYMIEPWDFGHCRLDRIV